MKWKSIKATERTALSKFKDWATIDERNGKLLIVPTVDGQRRPDLDMRWINKEQICD